MGEETNHREWWFIEFRSPKIPASEDLRFYASLGKYFGSILKTKNEKLYLKYSDSFGKVYYNSLSLIEKLKKEVLNNNIYEIEFGKIVHDEMRGNNSSQGFESTVSTIFDINGSKIALMEGDNKQFISVSDARKSGCKLFGNCNEAQAFIMKDLHEYLRAQAQIFFQVRQLNLNAAKDIVIDVRYAHNNSNNNNRFSNSTVASSSGARNGQLPITNAVHRNGNQFAMNKENVANFNSTPNSRVERSDSVSSSGSKKSVKSFQSAKSIKAVLTPRQMIQSLKKNVAPPNDGNHVNVLTKYPPGRMFPEVMKFNVAMHVQFLRKMSSTSFVGYILADESTEMENLFTNAKIDVELNAPSVGDLVIAKLDNDRVSRGYVLESINSKFKVAAIEYAEIAEVDKVYAVPQNFGDVEFVCVCQTAPELVAKLSEDDMLEVISKSRNLLLEKDTNIELVCSRWMPLPEASPSRPSAPSTPTSASARHATPQGSPMSSAASTPPKPAQKPRQKTYTFIPASILPFAIGDMVMIVGFDEGVLHIRSLGMRALITTMNRNLEEHGVETLEKPPALGQYVLNKTEKEYKRALVKQVAPDGIVVENIDYFQSVQKVDASVVFNFSPFAIYGPTLFPARLRHFEDKVYSPTCVEAVQQCVGLKFNVTYLQNDIIDLKTDANAKIQTACLSQHVIDADLTTVDALPKRDVPLNVEVRLAVFFTTDEHVFFCLQDDESIENITEMMNELAQLNDAKSLDAVVEGQLCITKYESEYCRAEVRKVDGQSAEIFFIDYGNTETKNVDELMELPEEFLKFCVGSVKATLIQGSLYEKELAEIQNKFFTGIAVGKDDGVVQLKLLQEILAE